MPTVTSGQSVVIKLGGTEAIWVNTTGVGIAEFECGSPTRLNLTTEYQRIGYFGADSCIELRSVSGTINYQSTPPAVYPLTATAMGDKNNSSPVDIALTVNAVAGAVNAYAKAASNQSFSSVGRRWAFFGDSITNGASATNFTFSYTRQCIDSCGQLVARRDYIEAGTPSETSSQILTRFASTLDAYPDVNAISILCGTNDSSVSVTPSAFISNVLQMFAIARSRGLPVVICTVPPRGASGTAEQNRLIAAYNILLRVYQKDYGYELAEVNSALVDTATGLMLAAYDSGDGVHPNNLGHIQIGQAVAAAMIRASKLSNKQGIMQSIISAGLLTPDPLNARATVLSGGWSEWAGGTGTAPVYTMENDTSGVLVAGRWAQMAVNSVATGSRRLSDSHSADFAAGDTILITGKIQIEDLSGTWEANCAADTGAVGVTILNQSAVAIPGANIFGGRSTGLKDAQGFYNFGTFAVQFVVPVGTTTLITWISLKTPSGSNVKMRLGEFALINMTLLNCVLADGQAAIQL